MKIKIYIFLIALMFSSACTDNFEEINTNPYQITDESLKQDFQNVGAFYPPILYRIFSHQTQHNLVHTSFVRHLATPTPFVSGINNTTYFIRWNNFWNHQYDRIMAPSNKVMRIAQEEELPVFVEWAKLIRIVAMSRLTAYHGPVIYSHFGESGTSIAYDSEPDLYNLFFTQLDEILAVFNANTDYTGLGEFDASYGGDIPSWIKFANSLRLRLAMRIVKVAPDLAQTQGEKAFNAPGGLIEATGDNMMVNLYGNVFPVWTISFGWGDTRMSASMESILIGYDDSRIEKFFDPATDNTLYPDHPAYPYKGIRNGALLLGKGDHLAYSNISSDFGSVTERRLFTAAETHFILAEAVLRNWNVPGTAQGHYEAGVMASFEDWGAGGADAYLANDTGIPMDYDDIVYSGDINDFVNRIMVSPKWNDGDSDEVKLEKIMTQKWIASYTNTIESWVDHRRTGYPKLPFNYKNDSDATWGVIAADDFLRRMPFVGRERTGNAAAVAEATGFLGGPDEIGTRLWWDTGGPNF